MKKPQFLVEVLVVLRLEICKIRGLIDKTTKKVKNNSEKRRQYKKRLNSEKFLKKERILLN